MTKTKDKTDLWFHECGCRFRKEDSMWSIENYCKRHSPNHKKKTDKLIKRREKKRGRGYTKSNKKKEK